MQYSDMGQSMLSLFANGHSTCACINLSHSTILASFHSSKLPNSAGDNPFHNWYHGFSVMHMAFFMLRTTAACEHLSRTDVLATMIGAVAHDIDHPGRNNAFEIATQVR